MRELSHVPSETLFAMSRTSFERPSTRCLRLRSEMRARLEQISASENYYVMRWPRIRSRYPR
jgi:hypothetical protein